MECGGSGERHSGSHSSLAQNFLKEAAMVSRDLRVSPLDGSASETAGASVSARPFIHLIPINEKLLRKSNGRVACVRTGRPDC